MSGGSMDYLYSKVDNYAAGNMGDRELNELMTDIVTLLHDREWCMDDDISQKQYNATVQKFKNKWFKDAEKRRAQLVKDACDELKQQLLVSFGYKQPAED